MGIGLGRVVLVIAAIAGSSGLSADVESARSLYERGAWVEAEAAVMTELEAVDVEGADPVEVATLLDLLVDIRGSSGHHAAAVPAAERAVEIRSALPKTGGGPLVASMIRLGTELGEIDETERSIAILTEACRLASETLEPAEPEHARCLNRLSFVYLMNVDLDAGVEAAKEALAVLERGGRRNSIDAANSLQYLGAAARMQDDLDEALARIEEALDIRERVLGPDDPSLVAPLLELAQTARRRGDNDLAEATFHRGLAILERNGTASSPSAATLLNGLGMFERSRGDYLGARRHLERAIELWENSGGPYQASVAGALSNLARVATETGDLQAALDMLLRAVEIFEYLGGPDHPNVARCLTNLGGVYLEAGDPKAALPVLERAATLIERLFGPDSTRLAPALVNLARAQRETGQPGEEENLRRAIAIYEARLGADHFQLISSLCNLATFHAARGELELARSEIERAFAIGTKVPGPEHPDTAGTLISLALIVAQQGDTVGAFDRAIEVERIGREHLSLTARGLSGREALQYDITRARGLDTALSQVAFGLEDDETRVRAAWDALIRSRGLVLEEMAERTRLRKLGDPRIEGLATEVTDAAAELARVRVEDAWGLPAADRQAQIEAAERRLGAAERALGEASEPFRLGRSRLSAGLDDVLRGLPRGWALVSFARYGWHDTSQPSVPVTPSYLAFVLSGENPQPKVVRLGAADEINDLVTKWRDAVLADRTAVGSEPPSRRTGEQLRRAVWDPVKAVLGDPERVLVTLDSQLLLVNLAALPAEDGGYVVERGPMLHVLADERDLADPQVTVDSTAPRLLAIGGVDFGPMQATGSLTGFDFTPLPSTLDEVEVVAGLWRQVHIENGAASARELVGSEASEANVKVLAPGATVLHFATHGFSGGPWAEATRGVGRLVPASSSTSTAEPVEVAEPLRLSGLALAGANLGVGIEDGILTAEEIATLDLTSADWVVLSACDSGIGEVGSSEGVFGLRRAFRIAGARSVVMSLWPVGDDTAKAWMEAFYRGRLERHLDAAEAVREASLEALAERRASDRSDSPAFWGVFLAAGDWR